MLIKKYNYKSIKCKNIDSKRHYVLDGHNYDPVPSVTTILSATAPQEDVDALKRWRKNVGYKRANQISTQSANRGTRVHKYLENFINTGEFATPGTNPYAQHANGMAACIANYGLMLAEEVWGTEVPLFFPELYGGTTDCVGIHDGDESIIDFKQSNKLKKRKWIDSYFIQTVAYGQAHNELYGTNIKKGVIMMVTPNWEYQEFVIQGREYKKYENLWWNRVEKYYMKLSSI